MNTVKKLDYDFVGALLTLDYRLSSQELFICGKSSVDHRLNVWNRVRNGRRFHVDGQLNRWSRARNGSRFHVG